MYPWIPNLLETPPFFEEKEEKIHADVRAALGMTVDYSHIDVRAPVYITGPIIKEYDVKP